VNRIIPDPRPAFGDTPIGIVSRAFGGTLHSHSEIKAARAQKGPEGPFAR
jgi:hypothetical protein